MTPFLVKMKGVRKGKSSSATAKFLVFAGTAVGAIAVVEATYDLSGLDDVEFEPQELTTDSVEVVSWSGAMPVAKE